MTPTIHPRSRSSVQHLASLTPLLALAALLLPAAAAAQQASPDDPDAPSVQLPEGRDLDSLPPPMRLGVRAEVVRRSLPVESLLVIAEDERAYAQAIDKWTPSRRFPVLIDDDSLRAARDIARFSRAFRPDRVLRVAASDDADASEPSFPSADAVDRIVASAWLVERVEDLEPPALDQNTAPPGVVVASVEDPAWTAALALAAGRAQPILWIDHTRKPLGGIFAPEAITTLVERVEERVASLAESRSLSWRALGDDIDAVALCLNLPPRYQNAEGEQLATTDRVGRHDDQQRWAWSSQIPGDAALAAYRAMCALFLQPQSVWLFDGYEDKGGFAKYDVRPAAEALRSVGLETFVDARPAGADQWRRRASRPIRAGLVHVNTAGGRRTMNLNPGQVHGSDTPRLARPAIVHVVHSYSAQDVTDVGSIAGRFLAHGAYAYVGAVHEPYLAAFHPAHLLLARLGAPAPLAAAARIDHAPLWKIAILGDPLLTLGPTPPRAAGRISIEDALPLEQTLAEALQSRDFYAAIRALLLMGRDADAVRLTEAVREDDPDAWTPDLSRLALPALFRAGKTDLLLELFRSLPPVERSDPLVRDLLWLAMRPRIEQGTDASVIRLLADHMRPQSFGDDAADLGAALNRIEGPRPAEDLLFRLLNETDREHHQKAIERALNRIDR